MDKKIIMFPKLETKIIENGLEFFRNKQYEDAIDLFEEGLELGINATLFKSALVISYIETNQLEKGKQLILELLQEDERNYVTNLNLAVMILFQLNEHNQIIALLDEAFDNELIPKDNMSHFEEVYQLSKTIKQKKVEKKYFQLNLFNYETIEDQLLIVKDLLTEQLNPYKEEISNYLKDEEGQNFFKTLLVQMLQDKNDTTEYTITKLDEQIQFIPKELNGQIVQKTKTQLVNLLIKKYENDNPTYLNQLLEFIERFYFLIYPFDLTNYSNETMMAGIEYKFKSFIQPVVDVKFLLEEYGVKDSDFIQFVEKYKEIE